MAPERGFNGGNMVPSNRFHAGRCAVTRYSGRLHEPVGQSYRLLALCPAPTGPVGQSWPRGTGSVGDSVGEGTNTCERV